MRLGAPRGQVPLHLTRAGDNPIALRAQACLEHHTRALTACLSLAHLQSTFPATVPGHAVTLGSQSAPTLVSGAHRRGTQGLRGTAYLMLGGDISQPGAGAETVVGGPASECPCGLGGGAGIEGFS